MAQVVCSACWLEAAGQALTQLRTQDPAAAPAAAAALRAAVAHLGAHPLVGRRLAGDLRDLRELVVSYGATGFIALYRFVTERDEVRLLTIRRQRDLGYRP
jgi:plasmid stabilization system protein ParE